MADQFWQIRVLHPEEAGLILPLNAMVQANHALEMPYRFHAALDPAQMQAFFAAWLAEPQVTCLVAEASGEVLGYALFDVQRTQDKTLTKGEVFGFLHQIVVAPARRRRGLGLALMAEVKDRLSSASVPRLEASYWAFNSASGALMAAAGLKVSEIFVDGPTDTPKTGD